ncbi:c-type cytochrome [Flavobacterium rhamnosiphilum]|uniref:C-type cytochrome n=1 Tax=Flavobacterium rhamnosiphilum TaxID=2541724 RepID=A0A4V2ZA08_9FLAO|nr:c-type cytochrome [Flavobacterium rhamnosiphilum]TDE46584.1 c-type cytochrome [Flavobacterium rhamnosiphilum]
MKKLIFIGFAILAFFSCKKEEVKKESLYPTSTEEIAQTPEKLGEAIFQGKGNCVACHEVDKKSIGPSIQDIAKIYKDKGGNIVEFLKENEKPIVDPSQYEVMKTNFAITEEMSDEELKALEAYMYSNLK